MAHKLPGPLCRFRQHERNDAGTINKQVCHSPKITGTYDRDTRNTPQSQFDASMQGISPDAGAGEGRDAGFGSGGWGVLPKKQRWWPFFFIRLKNSDTGHFGMANNERGTDDPYGEKIIGEFCKPVKTMFEVSFFVDNQASPRPQPFKTGPVSMRFEFVLPDGKSEILKEKVDSSPKYLGPGQPLDTSFVPVFALETSKSGTLKVHLELHDSAGPPAIYDEGIDVIVKGCM